MTSRWIEADWPAPPNVIALTTTRAGGYSAGPYDSFNLAAHVGDAQQAVSANRESLARQLSLPGPVQWLSQVHGAEVVRAGRDERCPVADASWSREPGVVCAVLTADCLPVLFCSRAGDAVAAAHAGWRGLLAGVLDNTVAAMGVAPGQLLAWLGPAIGPGAFEVGAEVRSAYLAGAKDPAGTAACFVSNSGRPRHFFADLYSLARLRLQAVGVAAVYGGDFCTYSDASRFYSYRRDGETGRMASIILLDAGQSRA